MSSGTGDEQLMPGRTQALYRKHRPTTFDDDEMVGQEHVSRTLRNAIVRGRVAHAYLFCGPRGTGKTTTARLLAKAVNCLDPDPERRPCNVCEACRAINENRATDIIEIDAASNRGIDDMKELRDRVRYAPTQLRHKFYIIDEVHQLTREAFNAFLKTLEEPPPNTTFVLATTDADKLPDTIASRCQRFDFHRIRRDRMIARIHLVCEREGLAIDDDAVDIVVRRSTGSLRDALSLIDMLATAASVTAEGRIDADLVRTVLGISTDGWEYDLVQTLADKDMAAGLGVISKAADAGQDMRSFSRRVVDLLRILMLTRAGGDPVEANDRIRDLAKRFEIPELLRINERFSEVDFKIRHGSYPQLPLELAFIGSLVAQPTATYAAPPPIPIESRRPRPSARSQSDAPPTPSGADAGWNRPPTDAPVRRGPAMDAAPRQTPRQPARVAAQGNGDDLQAIRGQWDRIRTEIKTVDRKVEGLIASTDPELVQGNHLYIVAAYPFHASKLSEPKAVVIVEDAIERVMGAHYSVTVSLRDDLPVINASPRSTPASESEWSDDPQPRAAPSTQGATNGTSNVSETSAWFDGEPPSEPEESAIDDRVRHAKAIFDATEIDEDEG